MTDEPASVRETPEGYACPACGGVAVWRPSMQQVACRACNAVVVLPPPASSGAVSFFLVPYLRHYPGRRDPVTPPEPTGVVPFRIDEADARERVRAWIHRRRGTDARGGRGEPEPLVATYVPYWQFSVHVHCTWRHTREDTDRRKQVWEGEVSGDYGEHEPGSRRLPADLLRQLPFAFAHAVAFDRRYLAGAVVEQPGADLFEPWMAAKARLEDLVDRLVRADAGGLLGPEERWPSWSNEKGWLILTPFYTTHVEVDGQRRLVVMDGHGGEIAGDVPVHLSRGAWLVLGVLAASLAGLLWLIAAWLV